MSIFQQPQPRGLPNLNPEIYKKSGLQNHCVYTNSRSS